MATRVGACCSILCDGHGFAAILVTKTFADVSVVSRWSIRDRGRDSAFRPSCPWGRPCPVGGFCRNLGVGGSNPSGAPTKLLISLRHNRRSGPACYLASEANNRNRPAMSRVWGARSTARRPAALFRGGSGVVTRSRSLNSLRNLIGQNLPYFPSGARSSAIVPTRPRQTVSASRRVGGRSPRSPVANVASC